MKGFNVDFLNFNKRNLILVAIKLYKKLKRGQYDIITIYGYKINILGRIIAFFAGYKNIITAQRSIDANRKWYHSLIDKITSMFVKLYISNSEAARQVLIKREKINHKKIITIHNGIDVSEFEQKYDKHSILKEYQLDSNKKVISVVANLREPKGHVYLIEAVKLLRDQGIKNFIVLFIGDGVLRSKLEEMVKKKNLQDYIIFLGSRNDIPQLLSITNIFVLPSIWEGLPGSIIEAMACKLPVIATDVGGVSELVVNNKTGFVVEPRNPQALANKIVKLLEDEHLTIEMGLNGYERVKNFFTLKMMVSKYEEVYMKVAKGEL
jgi:glycosyltransferase involved in cell wall biosynthesis